MQVPREYLNMFLSPWYRSLENPVQVQENILKRLLEIYSKTEYGRTHQASSISTIEEYREHFPPINYETLEQHLEEVKSGNYQALLSEPVESWVMTRGSTGKNKILPATKTHLQQILACGSRALVNYIAGSKDVDPAAKILNLGFPSRVSKITVNKQQVWAGYSSGSYARMLPRLGSMSLTPSQDEIDSLGPGITIGDWEARFNLVYKKVQEENVTMAMGVTPVMLSFAKHVKKKHGHYLKDLQSFKALFCTSVRKIHSKYAAKLKKYFGPVSIIEIYSATEGVYGQQIDDLPYVKPNYDTYFFEVKTGEGYRMLHELERGDWGELVISSSMFPRYRIGDMIESAGKNYFRIFGRNKASHILEHRLYRLLFGWLI